MIIQIKEIVLTGITKEKMLNSTHFEKSGIYRVDRYQGDKLDKDVVLVIKHQNKVLYLMDWASFNTYFNVHNEEDIQDETKSGMEKIVENANLATEYLDKQCISVVNEIEEKAAEVKKEIMNVDYDFILELSRILMNQDK